MFDVARTGFTGPTYWLPNTVQFDMNFITTYFLFLCNVHFTLSVIKRPFLFYFIFRHLPTR